MDDKKKILILLAVIIGFLFCNKIQKFTQENEYSYMGTIQNMLNPTEVTTGEPNEWNWFGTTEVTTGEPSENTWGMPNMFGTTEETTGEPSENTWVMPNMFGTTEVNTPEPFEQSSFI
tara:strand:- start:3 stop:356 length:354 start_codon:yes stop_codon:yes gene_type:complete